MAKALAEEHDSPVHKENSAGELGGRPSPAARKAVRRALDAGDNDATKLVSLAKAKCSDAYLLTANEGVQIFAGVGMTDEYDIGFYLKRARAAELTFGDAAYHRNRWAELGAY